MTVPDGVILPQNYEKENYQNELVFSLESMYRQLAQGVNGTLRSDFGEERYLWKPILDGTGVSDTFTYTHQIGWAYRQGLIVDCWFDVLWTSAATAAGNLYLILPYQVAVTSEIPFVGIIQSSAITYTGGTGIVINAISDTFRGEFWNIGSGFTTANQSVVNSGRLIGYLRYIGKADEL